MNSEGEIALLREFERRGEKNITELSDKEAEELAKIEMEKRHAALTKMRREQFKKGNR